MADTITFRQMTRDDLPLFHAWLHLPHVAQWWGPQGSIDELVQEYAAELNGTSTSRMYIALENGEAIGYIQSYVVVNSDAGWWQSETDPGARGIDQFLANPAQLNKGIGSRMIRAFVSLLFADPAVNFVQTDPAPENIRAIRCYEKVGFHSKGVVHTPDGVAMLMIVERRNH